MSAHANYIGQGYSGYFQCCSLLTNSTWDMRSLKMVKVECVKHHVQLLSHYQFEQNLLFHQVFHLLITIIFNDKIIQKKISLRCSFHHAMIKIQSHKMMFQKKSVNSAENVL